MAFQRNDVPAALIFASCLALLFTGFTFVGYWHGRNTAPSAKCLDKDGNWIERHGFGVCIQDFDKVNPEDLERIFRAVQNNDYQKR